MYFLRNRFENKHFEYIETILNQIDTNCPESLDRWISNLPIVRRNIINLIDVKTIKYSSVEIYLKSIDIVQNWVTKCFVPAREQDGEILDVNTLEKIVKKIMKSN